MRLVPASRRAFVTASLVALAATVAAAPAPAATAAPRACPAPHSGYRACLRAQWSQGDDGTVTRLDATVTLLQRVDRCRHHGTRRATVRRGDRRLATRRAKASCSHHLVRWRTRLSPATTRGWALRRGDTLTASWGGTTATARVKLVLPER
jgi:hypothetical protein